MPQLFTYYVPLVVQHGDRIGFTARIIQTDSLLDDEGKVWGMINSLTRDILGREPEESDELPVMPIGWTLITARRGPGVKSPEENPAAH